MKMVVNTKTIIASIALILSICAGAMAAQASVTSDSSLGSAGVGRVEVSMGDLIADAIRSVLRTDMAFISASEIREREGQLSKGKVTTSDVVGFVSYPDDPIVEVSLTGRQIQLALERSVLIYPQKNLGFLQVAGLKFSFDPEKPQEKRITSVKNASTGEVLSETGVYSVAMTSSMANGALGYWKIWTKNDIKQPSQEITIPDAVESFFSSRSKVNYSTLDRINVGG